MGRYRVFKKRNDNRNAQVSSAKKVYTGPAPLMLRTKVQQIMQLQKTIGNRAVTQMIKDGTLKLHSNPNKPGAAHQREIDALARQVQAQAGTQPVQRKIVKGTTHRSRAYGNLALSSWFKNLNETEQAFARLLHSEKTKYTKKEAEKEIAKRIERGDDVPTREISEKDLRLKRVREYFNENAPELTSKQYIHGKYLAEAGEYAYHRMRRRHRRTRRHKRMVEKINKTKPNLFDDQLEILTKYGPWQQMVALTESAPKTYDLDIGSEKVTLDSLDVKSHEERKRRREPETPNKFQIFIEQEEGMNSYWTMSDLNPRKKIRRGNSHRLLRHLEVERENLSAFTTYMKDILYGMDQLLNKEAFGDEVPFTFMEYKGASRATANQQKIQMASAYHSLKRAMQNPEKELGTPVGTREVTTAKKIKEALMAFIENKNKSKFKKLIKEVFRLIRTETEEDVSSDSESESDFNYNWD